MQGKREPDLASLLIIFLGIAFGVYYFLDIKAKESTAANIEAFKKAETRIAHDIQAAKDQVAEDSIEQYWIAKRSGNKMDACVHAGIVAAAYLQANNEAKYREWKEIESNEMEAVGLTSFNK